MLGLGVYIMGTNYLILQLDVVKLSCGKRYLISANIKIRKRLLNTIISSSSAISSVIEFCKGKAQYGHAYFFFDSRSSHTMLSLVENLIRSLILQFSDQCGGLPAPLVELYGNGHQQPSLESLHGTLQRIVEGFEHAFIIIDSLDECGERDKLLKWIARIADWKVGKLHLLVTSRQERDIEDRLRSLNLCDVRIAGGSFNSDIETYLDAILPNLNRWDEETQNNIKTTLMKGADGMYASFKSLRSSITDVCEVIGSDGWPCN